MYVCVTWCTNDQSKEGFSVHLQDRRSIDAGQVWQVRMCVCVYVYVCVCVHVCMYVYVCVCVAGFTHE